MGSTTSFRNFLIFTAHKTNLTMGKTEMLLIGMAIGFAVGVQLWWNEREYRKQVEKFREDAMKEMDFWKTMSGIHKEESEKLKNK